MREILLAIMFLLLMPVVLAEQGHMKLLAVSETESGFEGKLADLYLEIKPGNGRVFIETFPLTKFDTQISTRFAKEVACKYLDVDCSNHDFFYTIKSESTTVGGPSASAAEAALTVALLNNMPIDEETSITGTINSGGLIGPVGGIKEKIEAAAEAKLKKVLIPKGTRHINTTKTKLDLIEYGEELGLQIVEISDLSQAVYELTGQRIEEPEQEIQIDEIYREVMKNLAQQLCNKTTSLQEEFLSVRMDSKLFNEQLNVIRSAENLSDKGIKVMKNQLYYSAASYCFGANVKYQYLLFLTKNLTEEETNKEISLVRKEIASFSKTLPSLYYKTITDLQTYALVKERLLEAEDYLNLSTETKGTARLYNLAYAKERLRSAKSWGEFFGKGGKEFDLSKEELKQACYSKLSEAEERYQYTTMLFPIELTDTRIELNRAYHDADTENYELCLFKASKAKAEADALISTIGIDEETAKDMLDTKLGIIKKNIVKQTAKGAFPIVGYSYYEYAQALKTEELASALLYSEYSLELSNLNMYFREEKLPRIKEIKESSTLAMFWLGFVLGTLIGVLITLLFYARKYYKTPASTPVKRRLHGKKR